MARARGSGTGRPPRRGARLTRRRFLVLAGAAGVAGAAGAALVVGYPPPPAGLRALSGKQAAVLAALLPAVLGPRRAAALGDPAEAVRFLDGAIAGLPARLRRRVGWLLHLVEHLGPLFGAQLARMTRLPPGARARCLRALAGSRRREAVAGFSAIKGLAVLAYYRRPGSFAEIGYPGPMLPARWAGPATQPAYDALVGDLAGPRRPPR